MRCFCHGALLDEICGIVLTHLSGMGARCSRDMVVRRNIDGVVHQVRTELAQVCAKLATSAASRRLINRTDDFIGKIRVSYAIVYVRSGL